MECRMPPITHLNLIISQNQFLLSKIFCWLKVDLNCQIQFYYTRKNVANSYGIVLRFLQKIDLETNLAENLFCGEKKLQILVMVFCYILEMMMTKAISGRYLLKQWHLWSQLQRLDKQRGRGQVRSSGINKEKLQLETKTKQTL